MGHGGLSVVIDILCSYPDAPDVVLAAIHVVENISTASPKHSEIVVREGGRVAIVAALEAYADSPHLDSAQKIIDAGKTALLVLATFELRVNNNIETKTEPGTNARDARQHVKRGAGYKLMSEIYS